MKLSGDWFQNKATKQVFSILNDAGFQAHMVGGCVRNALLGQPVSDIDISTDATPETVSKLAQNAGLKAIPTGVEHGTVTVVSGGEPHEITTYRKDIETDGRRAVVAFSRSIVEDAERRDFTMNAIYADAQGQVVDPLGGIDDLLARRVRFIGSAHDRIREDYLRILRFFRFTAWYGDQSLGWDVESLSAVSSNLAGLETLSKERVGHEIKRLLLAPNPAPALAVMEQTGVLHAILDGADTKPMPILVHLEEAAQLEPSFTRRLAALGGRNVADAFRLSKSDERDRAAIQHAAMSYQDTKEIGYRLGNRLGLDAKLLRSAYLETEFTAQDAFDVETGATSVLPVKAADLMDQFQGAALGQKLRLLENRWIQSGMTLSKEELLGGLDD